MSGVVERDALDQGIPSWSPFPRIGPVGGGKVPETGFHIGSKGGRDEKALPVDTTADSQRNGALHGSLQDFDLLIHFVKGRDEYRGDRLTKPSPLGKDHLEFVPVHTGLKLDLQHSAFAHFQSPPPVTALGGQEEEEEEGEKEDQRAEVEEEVDRRMTETAQEREGDNGREFAVEANRENLRLDPVLSLLIAFAEETVLVTPRTNRAVKRLKRVTPTQGGRGAMRAKKRSAAL